jgi:anaerobic carbon-monoxide dehydrogenase iron sulfur subunit
MKEIICRIEQCLACKSCEIACAVAHSQSQNIVAALDEVPLPRKRLQVLSLDINSGRPSAFVLQCRHCAEPACVDVCIAGGVVKDEKTGVVTFNTDRCVGCWSCTMVCPFGGILRDIKGGRALKCDRCPERETPACVEACPTKALMLCEVEEVEEELLLDIK